ELQTLQGTPKEKELTSYYLHDIPGRLRIKSPKLKKNKKAVTEVKNMFNGINGISNLDFNLNTGSMLVSYDSKAVNKNNIINLMNEKGYFDKSKAIDNDKYCAHLTNNALSFLVNIIL
ncbi:MAG: hypothetical protein HQK78_15570, partial [Desulfobacterales bacterium]|nr:hypothetical protein [Desulfobacterales bacterium]